MRQPISQPAGEDASELPGMKIGIKRFGNRVQINLQCHGDYQAIELYDRLIKAAENGAVEIDLRTSQVAHDKD